MKSPARKSLQNFKSHDPDAENVAGRHIFMFTDNLASFPNILY